MTATKQASFAFQVSSLGMVCLLTFTGCQRFNCSAPSSRPFPLGAVSDAFWETQQTNAEAGDFIFFQHEFRGQTAELAPGTKRHLESVALRLEQVPFPVVIEQNNFGHDPELDQKRQEVVVGHLTRMAGLDMKSRVIIAPAFTKGISGIEGAQAYYSNFDNAGYGTGAGGGGLGRGYGGFGGGFGRRNSGTGGFFR